MKIKKLPSVTLFSKLNIESEHINAVNHSWQRGPNPPYFMKTSPYITYSPFLNFVQPPHLSLSPRNPTPLLFLLSCFFG